MGLWAGLDNRCRIEPIKLNQKEEIEPVGLNIRTDSLDFLQSQRKGLLITVLFLCFLQPLPLYF